ncbi:hypothetical protein KCM76_23410 [Zooshikella marina]|uniref:hypothetical protein n=1 Tax=Zooshikella ganghwensis TaxID=202772 RepID=UPI001BAFE009|nr:hypothetical protein [Zooshikella ganghwensis]MBU2708963.1 hypothetical protein [Zooshikella ganghwensis]
MDFQYLEFRDIDLTDEFFDSLKEDYKEFSYWFAKKATNKAYVFKNESNGIDGFLYHKIENEAVTDVEPIMPVMKRLKIGTFKINAHGTRLGERFIKKSLDYAVLEKVSEIYVTVFPKHESLIEAFKRYGFRETAQKKTNNGVELVLVKKMGENLGDVALNYPYIDNAKRKYLLALYPKWHSRLLPDSILSNENKSAIVEDVSHTNSIHKIYLTAMKGTEELKRGDILVIYRTKDNQGPAYYRSVATSLCVVEDVKDINTFNSEKEFLAYTASYSIFSNQELKSFYNNKKYPIIIKFCYNIALTKRVTRGEMIDELGFDPNTYWGFFPLNEQQFLGVVRKGRVDEGLIIN